MTMTDFADRYRYLALRSQVGAATFGSERHINQDFYTSRDWRSVRNVVIDRDYSCDLGIRGYEIHYPTKIYIHHMNPVTIEDIVHANDDILDPEFLITTTHRTHNAIHYGDDSLLATEIVTRRPGDTKLW